MARVPDSSSSDGEEARALNGVQAVPYEIRSAKRTAATGLLVSAVACLCSIGMVIHKNTTGAPVAVTPVASAAVGLSEQDDVQKAIADIDGLLNQARAVQYGIRPVPHHLTAPMALHAEHSAESSVQRQIPAGVQVFPISMKFGWVQVVVPQTEQQNATFGWLPEHTEDGATLLVEDQQLNNKMYSASRAAPPSQAELKAKWDEARAKNKDLQAQIAELQRSMAKRGLPQLAEEDEMDAEEHGSESGAAAKAEADAERRSKGGAAVKAEAAKVVDMRQLSKSVKDLHKVAKDLKADKMISSLGKVLG